MNICAVTELSDLASTQVAVKTKDKFHMVALDAANLFSYLESMYLFFTECAEIQKIFRNALYRNLRYISLKRINTVCWNSRELSIDVFLQRYDCDCMGETLQKAANDTSLERDHSPRANGLLENIATKQFVATALLFKEIFQFTGPLSRYLQSVDLDFSKAILMVNDIIMQLEKLRKRPDDTLSIISQSHSYEKLHWKPIIVRFHRLIDGDVAPDKPALTPQGAWTRNTFFVVLDKVISSMRNRFGKNEALLSAYHLFSPQNFKSITDSCNSTDEIREELLPLCNRYAIDVTRCGMELINFARVYETFLSHVEKEIEQDESTDVNFGLENNDDDEINDDLEDAGNISEGQSKIGYGMLSVPKRSSFLDVLKLLLDTKFHLIDTYPELQKCTAFFLRFQSLLQLLSVHFQH